ncbi:MAG: aldehyde dehydrogenase family protein, partial [Actinomycetota bacterium]
MTKYDKIYVNGKWIASTSKDTIQVFDSTDESVMATIPAGTAADVDAAAKAAHAAFEAWAALDVQERAKYM